MDKINDFETFLSKYLIFDNKTWNLNETLLKYFIHGTKIKFQKLIVRILTESTNITTIPSVKYVYKIIGLLNHHETWGIDKIYFSNI